MRQWDINKKEMDLYYNKLSTFLNGIDFIMKIDTKKLFKKDLIEKIIFVVDKIKPKKKDKDKEEDEKKFEYEYDKKKEFDYKYYIEQINDIYEDFNNIYDTYKVDDDLKKSDKRQEKLLKKLLDHNKTISVQYNSLIGLVLEILKHFKQFKKHDIDSFNILFDRKDITVDLDYEKKINLFVHSTKELSTYQLIPFFDIYIIKKNQTLNSWLQIKLNDPLFVFQKNDDPNNYLIDELDNNPITPDELQQTIKDLMFQYYKEENPIYIKKSTIQTVVDYINKILIQKLKDIDLSKPVLSYTDDGLKKAIAPLTEHKKPRILSIFNSIFDKKIIITKDKTRIFLTYLISFYLGIQKYEYIEESYSIYGNLLISYIEYILSISNQKGDLLIDIDIYSSDHDINTIYFIKNLHIYLDRLYTINNYTPMFRKYNRANTLYYVAAFPSDKNTNIIKNKLDNITILLLSDNNSFLAKERLNFKNMIFEKYIIIDSKFNLWIKVDNVYQHKSFQKDQQIATNYTPNFDFFYIRI